MTTDQQPTDRERKRMLIDAFTARMAGTYALVAEQDRAFDARVQAAIDTNATTVDFLQEILHELELLRSDRDVFRRQRDVASVDVEVLTQNVERLRKELDAAESKAVTVTGDLRKVADAFERALYVINRYRRQA